MRSRSRAGSRSLLAATEVQFLEPELMRGSEQAQTSLAHQHLVDGAEPTRERRVHGDAERDRLAVHRPSGRDDEVGERDEALCVDRVLRDDE